jgi:hypothetical protein
MLRPSVLQSALSARPGQWGRRDVLASPEWGTRPHLVSTEHNSKELDVSPSDGKRDEVEERLDSGAG